ncbi:MAG: hypothetical protein GYA36_19950 [Veillonellaceae bacterium]|nr:hypothetical protein [Veillonellaceae bacterium]
MSQYDDEFKNVKHGLPSENKTQQAKFNFFALFAVVGVIFAIFILLFGQTINTAGQQLNTIGGNSPAQMISVATLALLVGSIQSWVFKARIKSRALLYIFFSILGGAVAGLFGGILMNSGLNYGAGNGFIVGGVTGAIAGGISSLAQNGVMNNSRYGSKWFGYSFFSWAITFAIGFAISWGLRGAVDETISLALSAAFLMISSGIALVIFLNNTPQIEFS